MGETGDVTSIAAPAETTSSRGAPAGGAASHAFRSSSIWPQKPQPGFQKSTSVSPPRNSARSRGRPLKSGSVTAGAGSPLLGDGAHDGLRRFAGSDGAMHEVGRPMLHATAAALLDRGPRPALEATWPAPADMRATWLALDGDPTAWEGWVPPWRRPA